MKAYMINFESKELEAMELAKNATSIERYILEEASKRKAWDDYIPRVITGDAMSIYRFEEDDTPDDKKESLRYWQRKVSCLNNDFSSDKFFKAISSLREVKSYAYYDSMVDDIVISTFGKLQNGSINRIDYRVASDKVHMKDSVDNANAVNIHSKAYKYTSLLSLAFGEVLNSKYMMRSVY